MSSCQTQNYDFFFFEKNHTFGGGDDAQKKSHAKSCWERTFPQSWESTFPTMWERQVRLSFRKRSTDVEKAGQYDWRFATTEGRKGLRV